MYPLYFGQRFIYLLCDNLKTYEFEDEWLSEGHEAREIVPVLADGDSIRSALAKSRGSTFKTNDIVEACELHYSEDQNLLDIDPVEIAEVNPLNPNTSPEEVIKWVLFRAVSGRGSDLHVEKYYNTTRFRRIDEV